MGHRFGSLLILLLLAALGSAPDAQAVRKARVRVPTPLLKKVGDPPEVLRVLAAGTALHTSDQAKDGHYKAMTSDGVVGVIRGDALQFFEAPQTPATRAVAPTGATPRAAAAGPERTVRPPVSRGAARPAARFAGPRLQLRAFGGLANYGAPELNAQLGLNSFSSAMTGGVEVAYSLSRSLAVAFRAEYLTRTVLASDDSQYPVVEYNLVLTSLPLALGAEYSLLENSSFSIRAGLLVGSAPSTRLTATASNLEAPNEVVLSGNAWQALVKTDFEFKFSRSFGVFAGVGYRYLKTAELIPASEANGDALFRPAGGEIDAPFVPVPLNLSGLLFGAGANLRF